MLPHDSERPPTVAGSGQPGDRPEGGGSPEPTVKQSVTPYDLPRAPNEPTVRAKTLLQSSAEIAQAQHRSHPELDLSSPEPDASSALALAGPWPAGLERLRPLALLGEGEFWLAREVHLGEASLLAVKIQRQEGAPVQPLVLRVPDHDPVDYLGGGTYGEVLLYQERATGRRVAVKFFTRGGGSLEWQILLAEVKQLALMDDDPGIVQIKDVEPAAQPPYYIMTYAEHGSLAKRLLDKGPMPVRQALKIFRQTAEALAYVHAKGVRHCDLKPGNVLLDARDRPLLADFGQAHLASDLSPALGTFFYMAPEQATLEAGIADTRWDVYSLGALMYALVTGKPPHEDRAMLQTLNRTVNLPHRLQKYRDWVTTRPRPVEHRQVKGMDRRLAEIIDQCLEIDPNRRLHDAGAVLTALDRRRRHLRRRPLLIFGLIAPVVVMLLMTGFGALVGSGALGQAQFALGSQLCSNDQVMAQLCVNVMQNKLEERIALVKERAADPMLVAELKNVPLAVLGAGLQAASRPVKLHDRLLHFKRYDRQDFFFKWTLVNPRGFILADEIQESELYGRCWAWRDWFNGTGHKFGHEGQWFPPVSHTHISQPYVAHGIDERHHHNPLSMSITVPVRDPENQDGILALLVGTMHFGQVQELFRHIGLEALHGDVMILNDRKQCLMHRDMEEVKRRFPADRNPEAVPDNPVVHDLIDLHEAGFARDYVDPLTGKNCLAGYAPLKRLGWGVIVLHERDVALHPVASLRGWMAGWGTLVFVIMSLVTTGLWGALIWTLRREELPTHG